MKTKLSCAVAAIAFGTAATANAAFVVNDDTPSITAANPQGPQRDTTTTLSFNGTRLSRGGKATLDGLASDVVAADSINLTAYAKNRALLANAKRRVATVKDWLVAHGVPDAKVGTYTEVDPSDDAADTDVQISTRSAPRSAPALVTASAAPATLEASAAQQQGQRQQGAGFSDRERLDFARRVMAMAQAKIISGDDAIRLVNEFLNGQGVPTTSQPSAAVAQQPAAAAPPVVGGPIAMAQPAQYPVAQIAAQPQIVPAADVSRAWTLTANRTLRDNLDDWAQQAGYAKPTWSASMRYQITYTSNYSGTFLQVLAQIAQAVPGLDFKVSKAQHTIAVVDAQH
ncbi:TcpQ domain-containing protein (plasmid) [Paraburkholderia sprentiae WSM5005]|uniref:TcpQ domain-containing protein n=1 Tax=Paraburkholderia sprentiae WSM5005 TaxID=754502 RepID=A0ACA8AX67_9BURK|nr:TcpQ domain-containing protein [Paraburkholderia sprentiae]APA90227.1 TcpQ domain-containing protein [Paraburkholderia sprentiae WSM5005]